MKDILFVVFNCNTSDTCACTFKAVCLKLHTVCLLQQSDSRNITKIVVDPSNFETHILKILSQLSQRDVCCILISLNVDVHLSRCFCSTVSTLVWLLEVSYLLCLAKTNLTTIFCWGFFWSLRNCDKSDWYFMIPRQKMCFSSTGCQVGAKEWGES